MSQSEVMLNHNVHWCRFDGVTARNGPLSWAQQYLWPLICLPGNGREMDLIISVLVQGDLTAGDAFAAISEMVSRHPTLRTRISADSGGRLCQQVLRSGSVPVHVTDLSRWPVRPIEIWRHLPPPEDHLVQALIATASGGVRTVSLRISHVLTDGWGAGLLSAELAETVGVPRPRTARPRVRETMSSLDLADFERSPAGERARAKALEYATAQLSMAPQTMFPHPPLRAEAPRYWNVVLESAPLAEAIARLTRQRQTTVSVPVITAFAAIMATRASLPGALIYVTTSNRVRPQWRAFTGAMAQDMILHVPVPAAASFGDLSATVQRAALMTYRYGYHDTVALRQCLARAGIRRGVRFDMPPWAAVVNVHMAAAPTAPAPSGYIESYRSAPANPTAPVQVAALRIPWAGPRSDAENCAFFLDVFIEARRARLSAHIDTTVISVAESRSILRGIETVLAAFVDRDILLSDIPVICPGIGRPIERTVQVVDGSLVSVEDCQLVLMRVPEVHEAEVRLDDATWSLIADVHLAGIPDPAALHRRVVSALEGHGLAVAPHHYRLYSACPRRQDGAWQWAPQALVASGRGR